MYITQFAENELIKHGLFSLFNLPREKSPMSTKSKNPQFPFFLIYQNPAFNFSQALKNKITGSVQLPKYFSVIAYELTTSSVIIGRGNQTYGCTEKIALTDPKVSRLHATIYYSNKAKGYKIVDGILETGSKRSANGLYLGEKRIYSHELKDGDKIKIGDHILEWHEKEKGYNKDLERSKNTLF